MSRAVETDAARDIFVLGTAYVPRFSDDDTTLLKYSEITADLARKVVNLPVYIEHDTRYQIGEVYDAYMDERKNLKALLHVYGNPYVNNILPHALAGGVEDRYYKSFSLGNTVNFRTVGEDRYAVGDKEPQEISICRLGDVPGTYIDDYWIVPNSVNARQFAENRILKNIHRFYTI